MDPVQSRKDHHDTRPARRVYSEGMWKQTPALFLLLAACGGGTGTVEPQPDMTVLADLIYRGLAGRLRGFEQASASKVFRKFVDTPGVIEVTGQGIIVRLSKRAHNPLLKEAGLMQLTPGVPWLGGRCMRLECP